MRALVVSLGSIARRHIRNLKGLMPDIEIAIWRQHSKGVSDLGELDTMIEHIFFDISEVRSWHPQVALITNPASMHIETGIDLAKDGCHLFVEKPLSDSLKGVDEFITLCREQSVTLMIGYNFRFCRSLQALRQAIVEGKIGRVLALRAEVGQYLPSWRPGENYRKTVSANRDLGGGVLLELSHEIDYVRWLVGEVDLVAAQVGQLSDLDIDVEDTAELIFRANSGAIASIHLNMVQSPPMRTCRVIGTEGTLEWDGINHRVRLGTRTMDGWSDIVAANSIDPNEMYIEELRHFLACVKEKATPVVGGDDGLRVLELIRAAKEI
jgi:predicted dehydrogenase